MPSTPMTGAPTSSLYLRFSRSYGTAVPSKVILGGELLLVHTEDFEGTVNESEVENVISAAV